MKATGPESLPPPPADAPAAIPTDPRLDEVARTVPLEPANSLRPSYRELATLLPGLAAFALGLLYATGALVKTAQLRDAGVRIGDALPLVPIEQVLALGIGTMVEALYIVIFWALGASVYVYLAHRNKVRGTAREPVNPWKNPARVRKIMLTLMAVGLLFMATLASFFAIVATFAPGWFFGNAMKEQERGNPRGVIRLWVIAYSIVVAMKIAAVWYNPTPLPMAVVQTGDAVVEGPLIVARGDAWYVARPDGGSYEAIQTSRMISATVESRERPEDEPLIPVSWPWSR